MAYRRGRYSDFRKYGKAKTVEEGGIKARSKRGSFAESWWGKQWLNILKCMDDGRLSRGRTYARKGQVKNLEISPGKVTASVQGSQRTPYRISVTFSTITEDKWQVLAEKLSKNAAFVAQLLNGELPEEVIPFCKKESIKLFPASGKDIDINCNCPDWSVPCKHSAAVLYLIAEELDRDPFLLFKVRGKSKEEFLAMLDQSAVEMIDPSQQLASEPLSEDPKTFWGHFDPKLQPPMSFRVPSVPATLAKRLGPLPFWQGEEPFIETMEKLYIQASENTLSKLYDAEGKIEKKK